MRTATGKIPVSAVWLLAILLLLSAGITYRVLASHLKFVVEPPITLPVPLNAFPMQAGDWLGEELPIPAITQEYMRDNFADDFFSRRYINAVTGVWADVYVVYCSSRPGGILGHRPQVCYPAHGWVHDSTELSYFTSRASQRIPCLIHRFHKPAPNYHEIVVLSFYILKGQITTSEDDFSGPFGRRVNMSGDIARYVAQVQISSVLEDSTRQVAKDLTGLVLDYLPDLNGQVSAAKLKQQSGSGEKAALPDRK
ncbi:MAG: exosortase-associated EpsI family protein [Phycisphaerae bacterium]|nr:exosortase-associated EpsI family protein [Phycisphaerae bacterium]